MANPHSLPTIITFSAVAIILAVVAALLPSSGERKTVHDLRVEYGLEDEAIADVESDSVFDFLKFEVSPTFLEPQGKIVRSRELSSKKIVTTEEPVENTIIHSPADAVVEVEDNSSEIYQQLTKFVSAELKTRYEAVKSGTEDKCADIDNERAEADCRGEIYFQEAIAAKDVQLCARIENKKLKLRCQTYVPLIPKDAPEI